MQALENVSLIDNLQSHLGVQGFVLSHVTESSGVLEYLRNSIKGAQFISATSENPTNLVSIAARFGQTVVITDCDQGYLPAAVAPYIRYMTELYQMSD